MGDRNGEGGGREKILQGRGGQEEERKIRHEKEDEKRFIYRKVMYNSRGLSRSLVAYVQFFNFLLWLLFKCGFYSRAAYMQFSYFVKPVKAVWHNGTYTVKAKLDFVNVTKLFQNVNKHVGMQKSVKCSATWGGLRFSSRGFYLSAAYMPLEFGETAACIRMWLLNKCDFYAQLHRTYHHRYNCAHEHTGTCKLNKLPPTCPAVFQLCRAEI